jgi:murein DD-endopeptidase MepM/ murein hydrolase activator NlpD
MNPFAPIVKVQKLRTTDSFGSGHFNAPRGSRLHKGIDIITTKGQPIYSPIDGVVSRHSFAYSGDSSLELIEVKNDLHKVKIMYCKPHLPIGTPIKKGDLIAYSQSISDKYGVNMTNHVHFEAYVYRNGVAEVFDPTNSFDFSKTSSLKYLLLLIPLIFSIFK